MGKLRLWLLALMLVALAAGCGREYSGNSGVEPVDEVPDAGMEGDTDDPNPVPEPGPFPEPEPNPDPGPSPEPDATSLELVITPPFQEVLEGGSAEFRAALVDSEGIVEDVTTRAEWGSRPVGAALVGPGRFRASSSGSFTVEAFFSGLAAEGTLDVLSVEESLIDLVIEPRVVEVPEGFTARARAIGIYDNGESRDLTEVVEWSSQTPETVAVEGGLVSGLRAGDGEIVAVFDDFAADARVEVAPAVLEGIQIVPGGVTLPVGDASTLSALGRFSNGALTDITEQVAWSIEDGSVARVDNVPGTPGRVEAISEGETLVTASLDGLRGQGQVSVTSAQVVQLSITPPVVEVPAGGSVRLRASAVLSDDVSVDVTTEAIWMSGDPDVAQIEQFGGSIRVQGIVPGGSEVVASYGGRRVTVPVTVTDAVLIDLALAPQEMTLPSGTSRFFGLIGTFSDSTRTSFNTEAIWTSSDTDVAIVGNSEQGGLVTGRAPGVTVVTAAVGGIEVSAEVTVSDAALVGIQIQPPVATTAVGDGVQLNAFGVYSDNSLRGIGQEAIWSSQDAQIAVVSNAPGERGLTTGMSVGEVRITAQIGELSDTALVTVNEAEVESVFIAPQQAQIVAGRFQNLNAFAIYSNGATQIVTQEATWTSVDPENAQVSNADGQRGRVTGISPGRARIRISFQGVEAQSQVRVLDAELEQIFIAPQMVTTSPGVSVQLFAVGIYSDQSVRENLTPFVIWGSEDTDVATVSTFPEAPMGRVTGQNPGTTTITAELDGVVGERQIRVVDRTPIGLTLSPPDPLLPVDAFQRFIALAEFDDGTSADVTLDSVWSSDDASTVAVLPQPGLVNTLRQGEASVSASFQGLEAEVSVTVREAVPRVVVLAPVNAVVNRQQQAQIRLFATAVYDDNSTSDLTQICQWSSSNPATLLVLDELGAKGLAFGLQPGAVQVTARCGGELVGQTNVTVR